MMPIGFESGYRPIGFCLAILLSFSFIHSYLFHNASACQCIGLSPEMKYEKSDVIFLGKIARYTGGFVTFDVIKSWKGVDTRQITIRNGGVSACDSYPFSQSEPDRQYIVYAKKNLLEIHVTPCGGTITTEKFDIDYRSNPQL